MRGDLLFYRSQGTLADTLITRATHGPFTHVAVDLGDGTLIEAQASGIKRAPIPNQGQIRVPLTTWQSRGEGYGLTVAFEWLTAQVGASYGWLDIASQAMRLLGLPVFLVRLHSLDCSDLVARFMLLAGCGPNLALDVVDDATQISPNDLARALGILKEWPLAKADRLALGA